MSICEARCDIACKKGHNIFVFCKVLFKPFLFWKLTVLADVWSDLMFLAAREQHKRDGQGWQCIVVVIRLNDTSGSAGEAMGHLATGWKPLIREKRGDIIFHYYPHHSLLVYSSLQQYVYSKGQWILFSPWIVGKHCLMWITMWFNWKYVVRYIKWAITPLSCVVSNWTVEVYEWLSQ